MRRPRRLFEEDRGWSVFQEVFTPNREGPLPPRPHRSGKGGPSVNPKPALVTGSVWSAADAAANGMTLSNGGLTITPAAPISYVSSRTSISKTSGKLYVEFLNTAAFSSSFSTLFGMASSSFVSNSFLGSSAYSAGIGYGSVADPSSGFTINYQPNDFGMPVLNDVWAIAIDFSTGMFWIARNNVWSAGISPATGSNPAVSFIPATVGALFAAISLPGAGSGVWTLQPTAASQKYAPPTGFSPWG